jgi:hypothetical protein
MNQFAKPWFVDQCISVFLIFLVFNHCILLLSLIDFSACGLSFEMHVMCLFEFWWGKEIEGRKIVKNIKIMLISLLSPTKQVMLEYIYIFDQNGRELHWALIFTNYLWLCMWNYCFIVPLLGKVFFHNYFPWNCWLLIRSSSWNKKISCLQHVDQHNIFNPMVYFHMMNLKVRQFKHRGFNE